MRTSRKALAFLFYRIFVAYDNKRRAHFKMSAGRYSDFGEIPKKTCEEKLSRTEKLPDRRENREFRVILERCPTLTLCVLIP